MKHFDPTGVVPLPAADAPDAEMLDDKLDIRPGGGRANYELSKKKYQEWNVTTFKIDKEPKLEVWFRCKLPFQRGHFQVPTVNFQGSVSNVQLI